jgi:hypothetical protein
LLHASAGQDTTKTPFPKFTGQRVYVVGPTLRGPGQIGNWKSSLQS